MPKVLRVRQLGTFCQYVGHGSGYGTAQSFGRRPAHSGTEPAQLIAHADRLLGYGSEALLTYGKLFNLIQAAGGEQALGSCASGRKNLGS
jgi:hypothetical protein